MRIIWKYQFDSRTLEMNKMIPVGSLLLDVQVQNDSICAWFLVETDNELANIKLKAYMTGEDLPDDIGKHVATVQLDEFVFHIFDYGETENKL